MQLLWPGIWHAAPQVVRSDKGSNQGGAREPSHNLGVLHELVSWNREDGPTSSFDIPL
jgi:hypothetical protein